MKLANFIVFGLMAILMSGGAYAANQIVPSSGVSDGIEMASQESGWDGGDEWPEEPGWDDGEDFPPEDPGYSPGPWPSHPQPPQYPHHPQPGQPPYYGYPPSVQIETVQVRQYLFGYNRIPLFWLTNSLNRLQGFRLVAITINGYSQWGQGGAFFCSSQCGYPQPVGGYYGSYRIQTLNEPLNPYSAQWFLELRGNFAIDTIQLEFVR